MEPVRLSLCDAARFLHGDASKCAGEARVRRRSLPLCLVFDACNFF
jgi:hypothetical protein